MIQEKELKEIILSGRENELPQLLQPYGWQVRNQPIGWTCYGGDGEEIAIINEETGESINLACKITNRENGHVSYVIDYILYEM